MKSFFILLLLQFHRFKWQKNLANKKWAYLFLNHQMLNNCDSFSVYTKFNEQKKTVKFNFLLRQGTPTAKNKTKESRFFCYQHLFLFCLIYTLKLQNLVDNGSIKNLIQLKNPFCKSPKEYLLLCSMTFFN